MSGSPSVTRARPTPLAVGVATKTDGDLTLTSATFVDIHASMAVTLVTGAHRVLITVMAGGNRSTNGNISLDVTIDGVRQGGTYGLIAPERTAGTGLLNLSFSWLSPVLTAGSHEFKLQYSNGGSSTTTIYASSGVNPLQMAVMEQAA